MILEQGTKGECLVLEKHIHYREGLDAIYATVIFKDLFAVT